MVEVKVPSVGESIAEVEIGEWLKSEGSFVERDQTLVVLESEKSSLDLPAPVSGILKKIHKTTGATAGIGEVLALIEEGDAPATSAPPAPTSKEKATPSESGKIMPSAERLLHERQLSASEVKPSGPGGRLLKEDVLQHDKTPTPEPPPSPVTSSGGAHRESERIKMLPIRRTIAKRLVEAQQTAALLTTFNEVDMSAVMALRKTYQESFLQTHQVKLGFMSFFVKAAIEALKAFPVINAEIQDDHIVYHHYFDIGVAIGGGKGLVVPVLRNAELLGFAEIEKAIADLADRAKKNQLTPDELMGGTFTISNGGVYGSLLSTPIINPPQSGILGLHTIQERPVAINQQVVIRPMMYLALTYDHRIVDGKGAVSFLKRIKEIIEDPARLLLEI